MINSFLRGEQTNWDMNLGCLAGAYPASPHESTGLTLNLLMLGREIILPYEVTREGHDPHKSDKTVTLGAHALKIKERLHRAHHVVRKHLEVNMKRRKDHYDIKSNLMSYKVFDKVGYLNEICKEVICPKLQPSYIRPCVVTNKLNDLNYEIQIIGKGSRKIVNHDKLKPYRNTSISYSKWIKQLERQVDNK
jgi:hypothetical protein